MSLPSPDTYRTAPTIIIPDAPESVQHHDFARPESQGREEEEEEEDGNMGMMDFLTTPEMSGFHPVERSSTALTNTSRNTAPESPTFFDFVNIKQKKSMVYMTARESYYPVAAVTVLFFVWGFEYGLLDVLNAQFQSVASVTSAQGVGIRSAYYAGYFAGPLTTGRLVLKYWGFKACFPVGLSIYACGCLIFWPAAVLTSWPTFLVTNFIVGFGLSHLELAANTFIVMCGPARYAEIRLNLSQAIQAVGGVVAPLIADKAFFHKTLHAPSLVNTQWAYLGIALATVTLAVLYYYLPLPEASDQEFEDAAERMDGAHKTTTFTGHPVAFFVLAGGVLAQFCYVGAQEVMGTSFKKYLATVAPQLDPSDYTAVAHTAFATSRFLAAGLGFWIPPRVMLAYLSLGAIVCAALSTHLTGPAAVAVSVLVFFCEGPLFSLIFAQALRGQGRHTKTASVLLTASVSGGAVLSPISTAVVSAGRSVPYSLVVAVAGFAAVAVFALALNLSARVRALVDPLCDLTLVGDELRLHHPHHHHHHRPGSATSRASRALSFLSVGKKQRDFAVSAEYRERKASTGGHSSGETT
jgi:fucose permease